MTIDSKIVSKLFALHMETLTNIYLVILNPRFYGPDSRGHGTDIGPTWVLSAPGWPHVGPMNLAIRRDNCVDTLGVDNLYPCVDRSSVNVIFKMQGYRPCLPNG